MPLDHRDFVTAIAWAAVAACAVAFLLFVMQLVPCCEVTMMMDGCPDASEGSE